MKQGIKGTAYVALICSVFLLGSNAQAAHATNFLNGLQTEVSNRLDHATNRLDKNALRSAYNVLKRNTRGISADLEALASSSVLLRRRFSNDVVLTGYQLDAVDAYAGEADARLAALDARIGTNRISRSTSNLLSQAERYYERGTNTSYTVATRARALSLAFTKLRVLTPRINKLPAPPVVPVTAPQSLPTPSYIRLDETADVHTQTFFDFRSIPVEGGVYQDYEAHSPVDPNRADHEELGTWIYVPTGTNSPTAILRCHADYPPGYAGTTHDMVLTFTSATTGTFTGETFYGKHITGTFLLYH